jgi:hypothetical protein
VKVMCPHGHRVADVIREDGRWLIDVVPDEAITLHQDGHVAVAARYPAREELEVRPFRMLACPRECMLEHSWYQADSADLERLAATGIRAHRLTAC